MNNYQIQKALEKAYNRDIQHYCLEEYKDQLVRPCVEYVDTWLKQDFEWLDKNGTTRKDLLEIVSGVGAMDAEDVCWKILSHTLLTGEITLQSIMGMFFEQLGEHSDMAFRRGRILEPFIEAVISTKRVKLQQRGKYLHLVSTTPIKDVGQKRYGYVLPSIIPHKVKGNDDTGYTNAKLHAITGGKLKQHDGELCLDHISRLNNVCYKVETRIQYLVQPEFENKLKFIPEKGRHETKEEFLDRREQFELYKAQVPEKINIMYKQGNKFYLAHRYDTRLRTYLKAHHFDFIGQKFSRAFVQPHQGAVVTGVDEYV